MLEDDFKVGDLIFCSKYGVGTVIDKSHYPDGDFKNFVCDFVGHGVRVPEELFPYNFSQFSEVVSALHSSDIVELINGYDAYSLPMERRFDGDTAKFDKLMKYTGSQTDIVSKMLVASVVMREAVLRGLQVSFKN